MKSLPTLPALLALVAVLLWTHAPVTTLAAEGVEMTAELIVQGEESSTLEITTKMQGDFMRTDMEGVSTIIDARKNEILSILHDQKMFMTIPTGTLAAEAATEAVTSDPADFRATGRKEKISGFACEEYVNEKEAVAVWLTKDSKMPPDLFSRMAKGGGPQNPLRDFFQQASGFDGVPILITSTNPEAPFTMTVKTLRATTFPASEFAPPSGYQALALPPEMGEILQQMPE